MPRFSAPPFAVLSDEELARLSRSGDREAFGALVFRYQSLVCALAYSACGSIAQSEDIAQEVFVSAWKQVATLREPARVKEWLSSIARRRAIDAYRSERREPAHTGQSLEADVLSTELAPSESASRRDDEQLLWRALERVPTQFREPLVLYYREHQSLEHVAVALDLSEENARQRLSRGRKALQDEVIRMLEGTLGSSAPGSAFAAAVLAALPQAASPLAVGSSAAKGGTLLKVTLGSVAGLTLWATGLGFALFGMIVQFLGAKSPKARRQIANKWAILWIGCGLFAGSLMALPVHSVGHWIDHAHLRGLVLALGLIAYVLSAGWYTWVCALKRVAFGGAEPQEYVSAGRFLGLPWIHVRLRTDMGQAIVPAKGWIAMGDVAYGGLMAFGGCTLAPFSFGAASFGLVSLGCFAIGGYAFGFFAIGLWALGGIAVGCLAYGGWALAWHAAVGVVSAACHSALGQDGLTAAARANTEEAQNEINSLFFFRHIETILGLCLVFSWTPLLFSGWWKRLERRKSPQSKTS